MHGTLGKRRIARIAVQAAKAPIAAAGIDERLVLAQSGHSQAATGWTTSTPWTKAMQ